MKKPTKPAAKKPAPAAGLSHADVLDLVTGGAATWADRHHTARAKTAQRAPRNNLRLSVSVRGDVHKWLKAEASRRDSTVAEVLEGLVKPHLKR
jgi:hypothetical protein